MLLETEFSMFHDQVYRHTNFRQLSPQQEFDEDFDQLQTSIINKIFEEIHNDKEKKGPSWLQNMPQYDLTVLNQQFFNTFFYEKVILKECFCRLLEKSQIIEKFKSNQMNFDLKSQLQEESKKPKSAFNFFKADAMHLINQKFEKLYFRAYILKEMWKKLDEYIKVYYVIKAKSLN